MSLLEEVNQWGQILRFQKPHAIPNSLSWTSESYIYQSFPFHKHIPKFRHLSRELIFVHSLMNQ